LEGEEKERRVTLLKKGETKRMRRREVFPHRRERRKEVVTVEPGLDLTEGWGLIEVFQRGG